MHADLIRRFHAALPKLRQWIDQFVSDHAAQARAVGTLGFKRLSACYPEDLLRRARVVSVPRVPFPPVSRFGLPEFASHEQTAFAGITFLDTFFVQEGQVSERLHFHEMVHIVQWARLGPDHFLLAYGIGLAQFGYRQSPLEQMAYSLDTRFANGTLAEKQEQLVSLIERKTDAVWSQVAPVLQAVDGD